MQHTHKHTYIYLYIYICTIYTIYCILCGLFIRLWMKLLGFPVLWNTKTTPVITLASETAGPTFLLWDAEIKLCPRFHPPVGGARGCWKTGEKAWRETSFLFALCSWEKHWCNCPSDRTQQNIWVPSISHVLWSSHHSLSSTTQCSEFQLTAYFLSLVWVFLWIIPNFWSLSSWYL